MRLTLKKRLKPYTSLRQLADDLDLTIPELKKKIRELGPERLTLQALQGDSEAWGDVRSEVTFEQFHKSGRCLVCGNEMIEPGDREIGWGEFRQCPKCDFAAHELASYPTRKKAAKEQLQKLMELAGKTRTVLRDRLQNQQILQ